MSDVYVAISLVLLGDINIGSLGSQQPSSREQVRESMFIDIVCTRGFSKKYMSMIGLNPDV